MQQDAVRRVQEMQRIAKSKVNGGRAEEEFSRPSPPISRPQNIETVQTETVRHKNGSSANPTIGTISVPIHDDKSAKHSAVSPPQASQNSFSLSGLLSGLNLDQDRLIILLLLVVLMNEGVDNKLLLALCYLLL